MEELIGKTILAIYGNQQFIRFTTDQGDFIWETIGDCCSHTYIHDFIGVQGLIGSKVTEVTNIDLEDSWALSAENDRNKSYGIRIRAELVNKNVWDDTAVAVLSFRNESNGYYGGSLELIYPKIGYQWLGLTEIKSEKDFPNLPQITADVLEFQE